MRAVETETNTQKAGPGSYPVARPARLRKMKLRARTAALESLEPRTLMAVIPAAIVNAQSVVSPGAAGHGNQSSPSIAIDPTNPQHLVSVWTSYDTTRTGRFNPNVIAQGATSSDGGKTWTTFSPAQSLTDPTLAANAQDDYAQTTDASVDFDRNGNFYVVVSEHAADNSNGALVLNKFAFSNPFNPLINNEVLTAWTQDQALKPTLAVDHNLPSFSDVNGNGQTVTQTDPSSGDVYVAWATADQNATGAGGFNPNAIRLIASSDGGKTFSGSTVINAGGNSGNQRETSPRLAISQGSATVQGGQVSIVYDDFGSGAGASPPVDDIKINSVSAGVSEKVFTNNTGGTINDAPANPAAPAFSSFPINVTSGLPGNLSDLTVKLALTDPALAKLSIDLQAPDGTTVNLAPSFTNNTLGGTNLGVGVGGQILGTVFSQTSPHPIVNGSANYIGIYRPFGNLSTFFGKPMQTGIWHINVTVLSTAGGNGTLDLASLTFTSGLKTNGENTTPITTTVRGAQGINYSTGSAAVPNGIGPDPSLASDNTLGAFSPYQGRLYLTYVNRSTKAGNPGDNTDVYVRTSDDGGTTWSAAVKVNDDVATADGFSEGDRAQFEPSVAVDQSTGTLVVTYYDGRYDAARARVATTIATSIDGGSTFGPQTFANAPLIVANEASPIAGGTTNLGPIPDNESTGNTAAGADRTLFGFGDRQGLAVYGGHVYPAWSSNMNGGLDGKTLLNTTVALATIAAGPRVVSGTMGPVGPGTLNSTPAADGGPQAQAIQVTFDRPIDPSTFTAGQVVIQGRDVNGNPLPAITPSTPVPLDNNPLLGATTFQINFPAQTTPGTYSYAIGPNVSDRIRQVLTPTFTGAFTVGNAMDENGNAIKGEPNGDRFAIPTPVNSTPFVGPYSLDTLPLIVPGPHVISSQVPGANPTGDNLILNNTVSAIDVTFDRDMNPASFGIPAGTPVGTTVTNASVPVVRIQGPAGLINGPYSVKQLGPRTFEFGFPTQQLSGTYTIVLAATIKSASGYAMDVNQNAGVDALRQTNASATASVVFTSTDTPAPIPPGQTITSTIKVNDSFPIQGLTLTLDITDANDPSLTAVLVTPDGRTVQLFSGVGNTGTKSDFANTIFDDNASTPIANGGPPFFGRFKPQQTLFVPNEPSLGAGGSGVYTLKITNSSGTVSGTLNSWSLNFVKPVTGTGLGETIADQTSLAFRIFTMDPTNPLSSGTWTAIGPASIGGSGGGPAGGDGGDGESFATTSTAASASSGSAGADATVQPAASVGGSNSGRVGGLAVDPSDPSGNTVYVGGASGGVWKTTDFLTTSPAGPTYIPLTNFGPTSGINVGGIAAFGRNNDPNQSIIFVATGEGDTGTGGVGFLRSTDGGAHWTVLDSTDNTLPFAQRDHAFKGTTAFKVIVDPQPTPSGGVVVYAALSGGNGGIWRSLDSGETWGVVNPTTGVRTANLAGNATDVTFDPNSGPVDAFSNPTGNLRILYGALRGQGVYMSSNQGVAWNLMAGNGGDAQIEDPSTPQPKPVPVLNDAVSPNGGFGRIELAKPALVPSSDPNAAVENLIYSTWLYATVVTPGDRLQGVYLTKDNGANWTDLRIPTLGPDPNNVANPNMPRAVPSNDTNLGNYDPLGNDQVAQGNYDVSFAVDPNNPNITYLGGTHDFSPSGLIRIDATGVSDPHAFFLANDRSDGGTLTVNTTDAVALKPGKKTTAPSGYDPRTSPTINLIRDPSNPLSGNVFYVDNTASFANSGAGVKWTPFDEATGGTDQHRLIAFRDPLTGKTRLIFGDDQGVFTSVDNGDGTLVSAIGTAPAVTGSRNGNLQITQFYYGAAQPSQSAANSGGFLATGQAQDNGSPSSDSNVLSNGNISWGGPEGDGTGVATDQQGSGTTYRYNWPCCGGNGANFFQVNGEGRVNGLFPIQDGGKVGGDSEWPFVGGFNFALNPIDNKGIVMSSGAGRVFETVDQGFNWFVIGQPSIFGGARSELAFGAPETSSSGAALDDFIYAGTTTGQVFVTAHFTGSSGGQNTNWVNINNGALAGNTSPITAFATDPTRGKHDAYVVTSNGVYYTTDSDPTSGAVWQNVTGNLFSLTQAPFGDASLADTRMGSLTSIKVDWRYAIPDAPGATTTHPMLYVGGDGGVVRSTDNGTTWTIFPSLEPQSLPTTPTPPGVGGGLPTAHVSDLSLSIGNIDRTTGRAIAQPGDPNILLATTYGSGSFAIRLAPVVFANTVLVDPNLPTPNSASTNSKGVTTVTTTQPVIDGLSEQTAFGNVVRITLYDLTDPTNPVVIGGYNPADPSTLNSALTDSTGHFSVQVNAGAFTFNGVKTIGVQATDLSGTQGNIATLTFTLNAKFAAPGDPAIPTLKLLNPTGPNPNFTSSHTPVLTGKTDPGVQVVVTNLTTNTTLPPVTTDSNGVYKVQLPFENDNTYTFQAVATNTTNFLSSTSPQFTLTVKSTGPATAPTLRLFPADDTGIPGDNITSRRVARVTGKTDPFAFVSIYQSKNGVPVGAPLAQGTADFAGNYTIFLPAESDGTITLQATAEDAAGNPAPPPTANQALTLTFVTETADYVGLGLTTPALFRRNPNGTASWIIGHNVTDPAGTPNRTGPAGTPFGSSTSDIPLVGDFDGDGVSDLALYRPSAGAFFLSRTRAGGETISLAPYKTAASVPIAGDFDGDGITDFGLYDPPTGVWTIMESTKQLQQVVIHANPGIFTPKAGDVPVPGNYDSTGMAELAVYRPSTGQFFVQTPGQSGGFDNVRVVASLDPAGNGIDVPVPGNYDDTVTQHVTLPAVFNPSTGVYYVQGNAPLQFNPGDIPAPGDYNGLGVTQPAVYRPGKNAFYIVNVGVVPLGMAGDIPVTAPLSYRNLSTATAPTLALVSELPGSNVTSARHPILGGTTNPGATVYLLDANGKVINGAVADPTGHFVVGVPATLADGTYAFSVRLSGPGGIAGPSSPVVTVRVVTVQGDYTGAGRTEPDLFLRAGQSLFWYVQNFAPINGKAFGSSTADVPVVGDFLGTGRDQLATYTQRTGTWTIGQAGTNYAPQVIASDFGTSAANGYTPVPGDYVGNGVDVPAVYEKTTGMWFIAGLPAVPAVTPFTKGDVDIPVPGDYNNTGKDVPAVYRPSNQTFYVQNNGPFGEPIGFPGGSVNDIPVPGKYFSTATTQATDLAVWRPASGQYVILNPATGLQKFTFAVGDIPAPGDYDGIGHTEPAVFRPSTGQFLVLGPNDGTTPRVVTTQGFGGQGYVPVTSPYYYRVVPGTSPFAIKAASTAVASSSLNLGATARSFAAPGSSRSAASASPQSPGTTRNRPAQVAPAKVTASSGLRLFSNRTASKKGV